MRCTCERPQLLVSGWLSDHRVMAKARHRLDGGCLERWRVSLWGDDHTADRRRSPTRALAMDTAWIAHQTLALLVELACVAAFAG
jgi:hypothetical protein